MPRKSYSVHYIYKTVCKITNRFYIGMHSTFDLDDGYLGSGTRLQRSIKKYGRDNHHREILEFCQNRNTLVERERELITEELIHDPNCMNLEPGNGSIFRDPETGTNISKALKGRKLSVEQRKNIGKALKGRKNGPLSEEHKRKIREFNLGRKASEETKKKMSSTHSRIWSDKGGHTEESRLKMSLNRRGKWNPNSSRKGMKNSEESNCKNAESHRGKKVSEETKRKISEYWRKRREQSN